ncbi:hypothetical protein [Halobacteriovorax sp. HLS]|uniref:hypothetical protein n=1 Tax=Halobacteriovorax sp. HLS TaxID=2234000 RepID=UPI000FDBB856|nr:hypothetical protein [Halobacteriovorax sp. HLS]
MFYKITTLFLLLSSVQATQFSITGPCSKKPVFKTQVNTVNTNVGELSVRVFDENQIQHLSSDYGVSQLMNSPIGIDSMEILSDTVMRAHGWCYSVDGEVPELLMNEVKLNGNESEINWFMGYSTYIGDPQTGEHQWVGQCEPTHLLEVNPFPQYCN